MPKKRKNLSSKLKAIKRNKPSDNYNGLVDIEQAKIYFKKSNENLEVAKYCFENKKYYNVLVSRCFFCIFQAIICIFNMDGVFKVTKEYKEIIGKFIRLYCKSGSYFKTFDITIETMRYLRDRADYDLNMFELNDVYNMFLETSRFIKKMKSYFNNYHTNKGDSFWLD